MRTLQISSPSPSCNNASDVDDLHSKVISLGKFLGGGWDGKVYEDKNHPGFVLKFSATATAIDLKTEVELFNCYYGENSAVLLNEKTIRMKKISGIPLDEIEGKIFPANAIEKFNEMICKLGDNAIMHQDFHPGNILYDANKNTFNPIDFSNKYGIFFSESEDHPCFTSSADRKSAINKIDENNYIDYITFINDHIL